MGFFYSSIMAFGVAGALLVTGNSWAAGQYPASAEMPAQCDNAHFLKDQNAFAEQFSRDRTTYGQHIDLPEHLCGQVTKVLRARRTRSGWHGYFMMTVGTGRPIQIVSNLDEIQAPAWPWVKVGDTVEVQGRYYYDGPRRQGVDWTHHGTSRSWPWAGFVSVNGQRYQ
ncbi:DUF3465 domain-containing protein [Saccharibacter sp. 17.LH.SD]|uniref:DUF3465 domain-containing protein n=1 Tax=Saccharibacter sp. 17.LH.SD TaxID=2689393 RepID=UPI00351BDE92